jgi:hypothetical protein
MEYRVLDRNRAPWSGGDGHQHFRPTRPQTRDFTPILNLNRQPLPDRREGSHSDTIPVPENSITSTIREGGTVALMLSSGTRGRATFSSNDLSGAVRSALDDAGSTYVLGFYPPSQISRSRRSRGTESDGIRSLHWPVS